MERKRDAHGTRDREDEDTTSFFSFRIARLEGSCGEAQIHTYLETVRLSRRRGGGEGRTGVWDEGEAEVWGHGGRSSSRVSRRRQEAKEREAGMEAGPRCGLTSSNKAATVERGGGERRRRWRPGWRRGCGEPASSEATRRGKHTWKRGGAHAREAEHSESVGGESRRPGAKYLESSGRRMCHR
jgi:hypothetical protein